MGGLVRMNASGAGQVLRPTITQRRGGCTARQVGAGNDDVANASGLRPGDHQRQIVGEAWISEIGADIDHARVVLG